MAVGRDHHPHIDSNSPHDIPCHIPRDIIFSFPAPCHISRSITFSTPFPSRISHGIRSDSAANGPAGEIDTPDRKVAQQIHTSAAVHLVEALLGAPHRRCKSLILRQGPLPRRQEARRRLHKVPVKTLHIDTAYTVRQRHGNHITTMRDAYAQIGMRDKTGCSRGVILHAYISSQISVQQGPPRQILASAVLRNKGGDRMQIILARRRRQLRICCGRKYILQSKG